MTPTPRFHLGQRVTVSSTYEFAADWGNQVMFITEIAVAPSLMEFSYTTADAIGRNGKWEVVTDGWAEDELTAADNITEHQKTAV